MFRRSVTIFLLAVTVWLNPVFAQTPETPATNQGDWDAIVNKALVAFKIPGASVAVVKDGKVIYAKGFGYRDVEKKLPVTPDTLFAIGSVTKSFTSLVFGTMNDEGKVDWDKPIRTYLPTFKMDDPIATDHATARDLFSHRTGMPGHDAVWYSSDFSREDLFHRIQYLKPNKEFRYGYQYCNLMIMTMGYLEGEVEHTSWEDLVRTRVFQPLGMTTSNFSVNDSLKTSDFAEPYSLKKDVVTKVPFKNIDAIGPAGSINSTANDMSRYLVLQLGDGTYDGKRIVSQTNLKLVHTGQTAMGPLPEAFSSNGLGPMTYAMGWVDTSFRGHHMVWHNGGIDGFHSLLTMLPEDKVGVVILTNLDNHMGLEPIAFSIYDRLLGISNEPWIDRYKAMSDKAKAAEAEAEKKQAPPARPTTPASHPLADFAGDYVNPGYGTVKIAVSGDDLTLTLNELGPYPFRRLNYDIYEIPKESDSVAAGTKGQFYMDRDGNIVRLALPLEPTLPEDIVFTRAPEKLSREVLESLTGNYALTQGMANVSLAGDTLRLSIPGQSPYELIPTRGLSFHLEGLNGFTLEFKKDASGKIAEMVLTEPGGAMTAKKK
ncbi:MAG TPA: serine hydrolase [Candidatus Eisenbacteria bacterium]|nr:serine hydrolase [Candidatus Eisenbacteria bacterium]